MSLVAYPYVRWSSDKQSDGSSDIRQRATITWFCEQQGWSYGRWLTGDGISAWTGDNIRSGDLADFLNEVRRSGGHGKVLVCEGHDRLSRLSEFDFFEFFVPLLRTGLTVAFANINMVVDEHSIRAQRDQLRRLMQGAGQSTDYVEFLADRVRAGYDKLRDGGIVHSARTCPGWLELVYGEKQSNGRLSRIGFRWNPERVSILTRIFTETARGIPHRSIAKTLNAEGIETWKGGRRWHHTTIRTLVCDRAVLGEYQHKSRRRGIAQMGMPDRKYFLKGDCPQAISDELFEQANNPRLRRVTSQRSQGDKFRDLFSNLAFCHACGNRMTMIDRARAQDGRRERYLVCDGNKHGGGCNQRRNVKYRALEMLVVNTLLASALDDIYFQNDEDVSRISRDLATARRALSEAEADANGMAELLGRCGSERSFVLTYEAKCANEKSAKQRVAELQTALKAAQGAVSPEAHIRRVAAIRGDLYHADEQRRSFARRTVKLALNDIIERVEILPGRQIIKYPFRTERRFREGPPRELHYVPTEKQEAVVALRGGVRFIQLDLSSECVTFDGSTGSGQDDPALKDYFRRMAKLPYPKSDLEWQVVYTALETRRSNCVLTT